MKVWHDDIRQPPSGWVWARTNESAMALLTYENVEEISLDHDLGLDHIDPNEDEEAIFFAGPSDNGTGLDLVKWMVEDPKRVPAKVTIHSWNPAGASAMAELLNDHGHNVKVAAFRIPS